MYSYISGLEAPSQKAEAETANHPVLDAPPHTAEVELGGKIAHGLTTPVSQRHAGNSCAKFQMLAGTH